MKKNFVIINVETNGFFNIDDDKQLIYIEAIKIDEHLNKIDEFKTYIKPKEDLLTKIQDLTNIRNEILKNGINEKEAIIDFIKFCDNSNIITHNAKFELSFILKALYKNKITKDFKFRYIDIRDIFKSKENMIGKLTFNNIKKYYNIIEDNNINSLLKLIQIYLKNNYILNLKDLFLLQPCHGRIFRGLNYPKYLCDILIDSNKYHGYIIDFSYDKYISYYAFLKELNKEYFNLHEIKRLKNSGAKVIMNVSYLSNEPLSFVDYYSVQANDLTNITSNCYKLINGINNFVKYNKKDKKLKLILWGKIENLNQTYKVIDKDILKQFSMLIDIIKEPWDYWNEQDLKKIGSNIK